MPTEVIGLDGKSHPSRHPTVVRRHRRALPTAAVTLHIPVGAAHYTEYKRQAAKAGVPLEKLALQFIREGFDNLARLQSARK